MEHGAIDTAKLETQLWELFRPADQYLRDDECIVGAVYLGEGRSIGRVALCAGYTDTGRLEFEGISDETGSATLMPEYHYDAHPSEGTWKPLLKLGDGPPNTVADKRIWLLDHYLMVYRTRLQWLWNMPEAYKQSTRWAGQEKDCRNDIHRFEALRMFPDNNRSGTRFAMVVQESLQEQST